MGKIYDDRIVEFAYAYNIVIALNQSNSNIGIGGASLDAKPSYHHQAVIGYELKDVGKKLIDNRSIIHKIEIGEVIDSIPKIIERLAAAIPLFIAQDKEALSGYVEKRI